MSALLLAALVGCANRPDTGIDWSVDQLPDSEIEARDLFDGTTIALRGWVVDEAGTPIAGATVHAADAQADTDGAGAFVVTDLPRRNVLVRVTADGHREEQVAAWLMRPVVLDEVVLDPVALAPDAPTEVRFLFGGDTAFGRRYLDPDESTPWDQMPPDSPDALIKTSDAFPGTREVVREVKALFDAADFAVVNLETPVIEHPDTPHPTKPYVFFTLPGSVEALAWLGVDYVSLGNNHVYDYLEPGLVDTLESMDIVGMPYSGAGVDPASAWVPYRVDLADTRYAMVSATTISGEVHDIGYVANDAQGGAADARDSDVMASVLGGERAAGNVPLALLHVGNEYTVEPNDYAWGRMTLAVDEGAALVVAHHPHFAQGFEVYDGALMAHCLGNFAFDQERLETMLGLLLQVDMDGESWMRASAQPVQIEQYKPRVATGALADTMVRSVAEVSRGVDVASVNGRAWIGAAGFDERTITVEVDIGGDGVGYLDLRPLLVPGESLAHAVGPVTARPGRDILLHGSFEDSDIDDETMDVPHWDVSSGSKFPCLVGARSGAVGLCSVRLADGTSDSVTAFRNRVRVRGDSIDQPNKDLSVVASMSGINAGEMVIEARYYASEGEMAFGGEDALVHDGGDFDWVELWADLHMPADVQQSSRTRNPRAMRLFMRHAPPDEGEAVAMFDDLAVVSWEETLDLRTGASLPTPHARDYLRLQGVESTVALELTLRRWR